MVLLISVADCMNVINELAWKQILQLFVLLLIFRITHHLTAIVYSLHYCRFAPHDKNMIVIFKIVWVITEIRISINIEGASQLVKYVVFKFLSFSVSKWIKYQLYILTKDVQIPSTALQPFYNFIKSQALISL